MNIFPEESMSLRVLIADDHRIIREGLRAMLEKEHDIKVVGDAADGRMAQRLARDLTPDVVIMDVNMPELNGIEATRQIAAEVAGVKIIALSMHEDRRFVVNMLKAGASGYMLKDDAFKNLAGAIRMVVANKTYLSHELSEILENHCRTLSTTLESTDCQVLTCREQEVLQLVAEGKTSHQIADSLHISIKTVETHRGQLYEKLKVKSVAELTRYAIREGLTSA
jgi:DNA-binding NarL/FixJ family response regulator